MVMISSLIIPHIVLQIYNIKSSFRDGQFLSGSINPWKYLYILIGTKPSAVLTDICSFKHDPHLSSLDVTEIV